MAVLQGPTDHGGGIAVAIAQPTLALAALDEVQTKAKAAGVELGDAVVAFKTREGRVKIEQTKDLTSGKGARRGGFWGLLVGLVFGGPLLGAFLGLGLGAVIGKRVDHGIDDEFLRRVGKSLKPGNSALLLLIDQEHAEKAIAYLQSFEVEMHVTDFSQEAEEAIDRAADDAAIAQAVEAEFTAEE